MMKRKIDSDYGIQRRKIHYSVFTAILLVEIFLKRVVICSVN